MSILTRGRRTPNGEKEKFTTRYQQHSDKKERGESYWQYCGGETRGLTLRKDRLNKRFETVCGLLCTGISASLLLLGLLLSPLHTLSATATRRAAHPRSRRG
jgi:hypothetical protein